jgi:hypothetical protein
MHGLNARYRRQGDGSCEQSVDSVGGRAKPAPVDGSEKLARLWEIERIRNIDDAWRCAWDRSGEFRGRWIARNCEASLRKRHDAKAAHREQSDGRTKMVGYVAAQ